MSSNRFNPLTGPLRAPMEAASASAATTPKASDQKPRAPPKKRKGHRGGKKKRSRRKSFAVLHEDGQDELEREAGDGFYQAPAGNLSGTSIDSEALLDHREHHPMRVRRSSTIGGPSPFKNPFATPGSSSRLRPVQTTNLAGEGDSSFPWDERAPLLPGSPRNRGSPMGPSSYGASDSRANRNRSRRTSSKSSRTRLAAAFGAKDQYDVNNPPSVPASPILGPSDRIDMGFGDVMIRDEIDMRDESPGHSIEESAAMSDSDGRGRDHRQEHDRRMTMDPAADICFPVPGMSEMGDDEMHDAEDQGTRRQRPRRRRAQWPDLSILNEWMLFEKEDRSEERRVKKITEPQLINGRLRPVRKGWFQTDEEAPFRFTYFNEEFKSTIHSQTISELVQQDNGFQELFIPEPRILSDDESDTDDDTISQTSKLRHPAGGADGDSKMSTRQPSVVDRREGTLSPQPRSNVTADHSRTSSELNIPPGAMPPGVMPSGAMPPGAMPPGVVPSGAMPPGAMAPGIVPPSAIPPGTKSYEGSIHKTIPMPTMEPAAKPVRYGDRPVWWLDVLCPTEAEMKIISKAFGIHPLTAEDIMLQEAREKVELFRHYYFVNYRTFDQDINSENYLEPVNMYVVVFREGALSFHFSVTPHPANVRRRIRQLKDYLILSSDWISYAIIDDITDVFQPLIQNIEDEVDEIDDAILKLHSSSDKRMKNEKGASKNDDNVTVTDPSGDMLRRVGDCRKRVMSLYRLLGNKADVIKGFAKRCNERWEVAPRSEIGLYLGDIQDHIVTMTSNLGHYEKILARSHGNYLAQINIRMNERQEQTADVLGKLTVLGTIVLPMNIITGLWGMNVWVPGQEYEGDLVWFFWITVGLVMFGLTCYITAKRVYKIV